MKTCILTVIKNEHLYLEEWIKYHLDLGIDHIFIFEDLNSESHKEITNKYINFVTLYEISNLFNEEEIDNILKYKINKKQNPHNIYLKKCLSYLHNNFSNEYDWCFAIDNDEFITFEEGKDLSILSLYNDYDALILSWKRYGANGLVKCPDYSKSGVVDTYKLPIQGRVPLLRQSYDKKVCYHLSQYKPEFWKVMNEPSKKAKYCNTDFNCSMTNITYTNLYLRHYITRSWEEYVWKVT